MRTDVLNRFRLRLVRSAALVSVAALASGCSADATRLHDGFYTGAIPQAPIQNQQMASVPMGQPMNSGQPNASYGAGTTGASQTYAAVATPPVSRSTLPPPPAASYGDGGASYQPMNQAVSQAPIGSQQISQTQASRAMGGSQAARPAGGTYTVTSGDSLLGIARRTGVNSAAIRSANGLTSDDIRIGQVLTLPGGANGGNTRVASLGAPPTSLQAQAASIPAPRASPAKPARTASVAAATTPKAAAPAAIAPAHVAAKPQAVEAPTAASTAVAAAAPAAPATTMAQEEKQEEASLAPASTGIDQFRWPVQGRVVKNFGDKVGSRRNDGLNISVPRGTPVKAAENGVVIYAGEGLKEFGKTVLVKHDNGLVTVYGYADDILVQRGATVKRGQEIAKAGMTGETDTPMLHFEVRKDSSPVNPMTYLQ